MLRRQPSPGKPPLVTTTVNSPLPKAITWARPGVLGSRPCPLAQVFALDLEVRVFGRLGRIGDLGRSGTGGTGEQTQRRQHSEQGNHSRHDRVLFGRAGKIGETQTSWIIAMHGRSEGTRGTVTNCGDCGAGMCSGRACLPRSFGQIALPTAFRYVEELLHKEFSMSTADASQPAAPSPQELKAALKAFRKRLKLTQLDDQSRIGVGPMSSGRAVGDRGHYAARPIPIGGMGGTRPAGQTPQCRQRIVRVGMSDFAEKRDSPSPALRSTYIETGHSDQNHWFSKQGRGTCQTSNAFWSPAGPASSAPICASGWSSRGTT